ncbi:MAG: hypothetical protein AAF268_05485, partial [Cyanobacteria bacterium P01_A01_bin.3]
MSENRSDFFTGLVAGAFMGGVVGGVLGAVLTQQLAPGKSKSSRRRAKSRRSRRTPPRSLAASVDSQELLDEVRQDADLAIAEARRSLEDKISQLNAAIEDTRANFLATGEQQNGSATELQD